MNEVLLSTEEGKITEGLSSNFFAIRDGKLYTAEQDILFGTVRGVVIEVCKEEKIPVVLESPHTTDLKACEAAFITSTSRLVLPIDEIAVCRHPTQGDTSALIKYSVLFPENILLQKIVDGVKAKIIKRSTAIIE